jgi:hypothetical protein
MPLAEFEPAIPVSARPQTHALDRAATGDRRFDDISTWKETKTFFQILSYFRINIAFLSENGRYAASDSKYVPTFRKLIMPFLHLQGHTVLGMPTELDLPPPFTAPWPLQVTPSFCPNTDSQQRTVRRPAGLSGCHSNRCAHNRRYEKRLYTSNPTTIKAEIRTTNESATLPASLQSSNRLVSLSVILMHAHACRKYALPLFSGVARCLVAPGAINHTDRP